MKHVLIITSRSEKTVAWQERERYVQEFCDQLNAVLDDVSVRFTTYRDLCFTVWGNQTEVFDLKNGRDLKNVDLVHFKNWQYEIGQAPVVAAYLQRHGVAFYNSEVSRAPMSGKLAQMFVLAENGVPVPDTFYAAKDQLIELFQKNELPPGFAFPVIMKADDGSKGDDNHLVRSSEQAIDILTASQSDKEYVLQGFIPNDGDYRLLYVGLDNDEPLIFHRQAVAGSHLNNTSKGGTGKFMNAKEFPIEYKRFARKSAELLGREIGGVDVLVDKDTQKAYVLEVNGTPALATGYGVETKTKRFAEFLRHALDAKEEE